MTLQAGDILQFGITDTVTYGIVQSVDDEEVMRRATAIAPDGAVVSIQEYAEQANLTLTYLPLSGESTDGDRPIIGDPFVYAGSTWQIDSIVDTKTVDGFNAKTVEAKWFPKIH